ncbi:3-deoxy-manno-octulosonate cytidylyltransferase [Psychrobacter sp. AOP22-C1-22]|uniref:3-deoxy-manno-octulosonate cytidylyltransferase n=1 Tax=unclassified Psychrobacter TaxID=196806 RepID=UPI0017884359|nr:MULTISPECIES: 3-deoxy-manno-octulosonate cytidylyltransferase [unclassified Psychrobacter]MBE0407814.1 3-deoxy-manno-octulosonate cytidylyltransferase [Psychrobacter sp. FME6]MBE0445437.1 3-deoxy-manno-octulosonate cytidylyltransferase [Psychrobacter sp. FME5]MDN5802304.1 3-deoxy-manno-octulosonate cytidylyltransferase [Psychrobacter sp.]
MSPVATPAKTHIVIPARFKSTRLPGKPLLSIHGKPMILWVAEKAQAAHFADDMCIATDDESIAKVCIESGFDVVMTSSEHASGTDRLAEVAAIKGWADQDIVVNMQGDEPLVPPLLLEQVRALLVADSASVMATLYEPIDDYETFMRPSVVKVVSQQFNDLQRALYFSRAPIPCDRDVVMASENHQYPPKNAYRHLGLYAYRVRLLQQFVHWPQTPLEILESLEQLRVLENGGNIAIAAAACQLPAGVDTQEDLDRLNSMSLMDFQNPI